MTFEAQLFIRQPDRMRAGLHVLFLSISSSSSCAAGRSSSSSSSSSIRPLLLLTLFLLFALRIVKELILDDVSWIRNRFLSPVRADSLDCFLFFPSFSVFFFFSGSSPEVQRRFLFLRISQVGVLSLNYLFLIYFKFISLSSISGSVGAPFYSLILRLLYAVIRCFAHAIGFVGSVIRTSFCVRRS